MSHPESCSKSKCVEHDEFMAKYKKLVFERESLWEKLLKEYPKDVPNSLHQEFKVLLQTLGIISIPFISQSGNQEKDNV